MSNHLGGRRRRLAVAAAGAAALASTGALVAPANATTTVVHVSTISALQNAVNYQGTGLEDVIVDANMSAIPAHGSGLVESAASNVTIDLAGHRVSITTMDKAPAVVVGANGTLTITDSVGDGQLIAASTKDPNTSVGSVNGGAGIQSASGHLIIDGLATVVATGSGDNDGCTDFAPGIGGSTNLQNGGAVSIGGSASVTAIASSTGNAPGIGAADSCGGGPGADVTITGSPTISVTGWIPAGRTVAIGGAEGGSNGSLTEPVPAIGNLSATSGSSASGSQITIAGTGFLGPQFVTALSVGGHVLSRSAYTVQNGTTIVATLPAHAAGTVPIVVSTAGGTSNEANFTYVAPPAVRTAHPPVVLGTYVVGRTLTLRTYAFVPSSATVHIQWLLAGRPIAGATGHYLKLVRLYRGKRISAVVTATHSGYRGYRAVVGGHVVR